MNFKNLKHRFQHIPIAYSGLALGVGGMGNLLLNISQFNNNYDAKWITAITISITSIFIFLILIRNITHFKVLRYELREPLSASLLPTFSMSLMLISGFIGMWDKNKHSANQYAASILMCLAVLLQLIMICYFINVVIKNHIKSKEQHMYGSYFVPVVGMITACTVQGSFTLLPAEFFQIIWFIGWITFILTLPIITYSLLFKEKKVSNAQFPSVAVWFAPANLTCAGYVQSFLLAQNKIFYYPQEFLTSMLIFTVILGFATTLLLYLYLVRIFVLVFKNKKNGFTPILCSLSFPCAIGGTSMIFTAKYLLSVGFETGVWFFFISATIFAIVTFTVISYLIINMFMFAWKTLFTTHKDEQSHIVYKN